MALTQVNFSTPPRTKKITSHSSRSEPRNIKKTENMRKRQPAALFNLLTATTPGSNQAILLNRSTVTSEEHNITIERITVLSRNEPIGIGYSSSWRNADSLFHKEAHDDDWAGTYFGDTISQACGYIDDYSHRANVTIYQLSLRECSELTIYYCSGLGISNSTIPKNEKSEHIKTLLGFPPTVSLMKSLEAKNAVYIGPSTEEGSDKEIIVPIQYSALTIEEKKSYFIRTHVSGHYDLFEKESPVKYNSRQTTPGEKLKRELSTSVLLDYSLTDRLFSDKENISPLENIASEFPDIS